MKNAVKLLSAGVATVCALTPSLGFAWGSKGHAIVAEVAAELAAEGGQFWAANSGNMGRLSTVADRLWKAEKTAASEKPTHYFELDALVSNPSEFPSSLFAFVKAVAHFGQDKIQGGGTAPWRGDQLFDLAAKSVKAGDYSRTVQMAGALTHYVGDLSQPLHVSENYDGPKGTKTGIHSFFESKNLDSADKAELKAKVAILAKAILDSGRVQESFSGGFLNGTFALAVRSSEFSERVIRTDETEGRSGKGADIQLQLAIEQMADGAASMAVVFSEIWQAGGSPKVKPTSVSSPDPKFVPVDFSSPSAGAPASADNGLQKDTDSQSLYSVALRNDNSFEAAVPAGQVQPADCE